MTILSRIIETKRAEVAARKATISLADLDARIAVVTKPRGFRAALDAIGYNGWMTIEGGSLTPAEHRQRLGQILAGE